MNRIKRLSNEILSEHKEEFSTDFQENKKTLDNISIIRSKGLKNELAGFITKFLKKENLNKKMAEERIKESKNSSNEEEATTESTEATPEPVEATPEPVEATPEPVEATPEPVEATPEPVESTPEESSTKSTTE